MDRCFAGSPGKLAPEMKPNIPFQMRNHPKIALQLTHQVLGLSSIFLSWAHFARRKARNSIHSMDFFLED